MICFCYIPSKRNSKTDDTSQFKFLTQDTAVIVASFCCF